jgi:hypothetical protein
MHPAREVYDDRRNAASGVLQRLAALSAKIDRNSTIVRGWLVLTSLAVASSRTSAAALQTLDPVEEATAGLGLVGRRSHTVWCHGSLQRVATRGWVAIPGATLGSSDGCALRVVGLVIFIEKRIHLGSLCLWDDPRAMRTIVESIGACNIAIASLRRSDAWTFSVLSPRLRNATEALGNWLLATEAGISHGFLGLHILLDGLSWCGCALEEGGSSQTVRLLSVDDLTGLGVEFCFDSRFLPLSRLGRSKVWESLSASSVEPVEIDVFVERPWAAKRVVRRVQGESLHGSTNVLLSVAMRLYSVVRTIVVNHARSVDTSHVQLVNQIETLRPANLALGAAGLAVLGTFLSLPPALPAPSLLVVI